MSPKVMAPVGQVWAQAVVIAPTCLSSYLRPLAFSSSRTSRVRWTQKLHFSITPLERTETAGLRTIISGARVSSALLEVLPSVVRFLTTRSKGASEPTGPARYFEYS